MKFIFPQNYNFSLKLLGFIEYSTAIVNLIYWGLLYIILNFFLDNITIILSLFIILALPIFILSILGYKEKFYHILYYLLLYSIKPKVYVYSKASYIKVRRFLL